MPFPSSTELSATIMTTAITLIEDRQEEPAKVAIAYAHVAAKIVSEFYGDLTAAAFLHQLADLVEGIDVVRN